ncbi:MAG: hypothetical protein NC293_09625 [Roseburia sp.]|nr:hypothetical protein [Roseburia sp.]
MKQRRMKRAAVVTALVLVICMSVTACGTDFDAKRYVQGCLDAMTKGKFDDYTAMANINAEEAQKQYDESMDQEMKAMMGSLSLSEELQQEYREMFKNLYAKCKYEVGEAVKNSSDSYTVPVKVYKMKIFEGIMQDAQKEATEYVNKQMKKNPDKVPSKEDVTKKTLEYLLELMTKKLENVEYGEETNIDVAVTRDKSQGNVFAIPDATYTQILNACMDAKKASS